MEAHLSGSVAGDLNLPNINWKYCNLSSNNVATLFLVQYFYRLHTRIWFCTDSGRFSHKRTCTEYFRCLFHKSSLIYIIYEYICKPLTGISDHEISSAVDIELQKPISYLWHKADFDYNIKTLANSLVDAFLTKYDHNSPINTLWHDFKSICSSCLSCVPTRIRSQRSHQPWINTNIK